jgi:uncharacterized protein YdhG (YjbR/CyaY superfamily)
VEAIMNDVLNYINEYDSKDKLLLIRELILNKVPDATELISWGMPTYKKKHNLIHFACFKNHIGIYPGPDVITSLKEKLYNYKTSKGAIQIPLDKDVPIDLINAILDEVIVYNS